MPSRRAQALSCPEEAPGGAPAEYPAHRHRHPLAIRLWPAVPVVVYRPNDGFCDGGGEAIILYLGYTGMPTTGTVTGTGPGSSL